jgi:hypothetical protein
MKLLTACGLLLALSPMKLTTAPPPELGLSSPKLIAGGSPAGKRESAVLEPASIA